MRLPVVFYVGTCLACASAAALGQAGQGATGVPTATRWTLDAAGPSQGSTIRSVYLLVCPAADKEGTAFLLKDGTMVTDEHVVAGCTKEQLYARSAYGREVRFSKVVTDRDRDLALLVPSEKLLGGLDLGPDTGPAVGTRVSTWGFPLTYSGPAPLLSVGYVAGYAARTVGGRTVKHVVVNGAFNPGNSGGPVLKFGDDKVIGIVVWKMVVIPGWVEQDIGRFMHPFTKVSGNFGRRLPDGTIKPISDQEMTGLILDQFYKTVQVVIGEATAASELRDFIKSHQTELTEPPR